MNAECKNTIGSFLCECSVGFIGNGVACKDVDECAVENHDCHSNASCSNIDGGFNCSCTQGYSGDGITCTDVDECSLDTNNCDAYATCKNEPGTFSCTCKSGFNGNGVTCSDINECLTSNRCDFDHHCYNTIGSYFCGKNGNKDVLVLSTAWNKKRQPMVLSFNGELDLLYC